MPSVYRAETKVRHATRPLRHRVAFSDDRLPSLLLQDGKRAFGSYTTLLEEPQFIEQGHGDSHQCHADHRFSFGRKCRVQRRSHIVYLGRIGVAPFQRSRLPLYLGFAHDVTEVHREPASVRLPFA
jgi:hypothetical protein